MRSACSVWKVSGVPQNVSIRDVNSMLGSKDGRVVDRHVAGEGGASNVFVQASAAGLSTLRSRFSNAKFTRCSGHRVPPPSGGRIMRVSVIPTDDALFALMHDPASLESVMEQVLLYFVNELRGNGCSLAADARYTWAASKNTSQRVFSLFLDNSDRVMAADACNAQRPLVDAASVDVQLQGSWHTVCLHTLQVSATKDRLFSKTRALSAFLRSVGSEVSSPCSVSDKSLGLDGNRSDKSSANDNTDETSSDNCSSNSSTYETCFDNCLVLDSTDRVDGSCSSLAVRPLPDLRAAKICNSDGTFSWDPYVQWGFPPVFSAGLAEQA